MKQLPAGGAPTRSSGFPRAASGLALAALLVAGCSPRPAPTPAESAPQQAYVPVTTADGKLLSPLALAGRQVFVDEGCFVCHRVVATPPADRVGAPSNELLPIAGPPSAPELTHVGGKYPDLWHVYHLRDPRLTSPESTMPAFAALLDAPLASGAAARSAAQGVVMHGGKPVDPALVDAELRGEAAAIRSALAAQGATVAQDSKLVALIAYLQQLGPDEQVEAPPEAQQDCDAVDAALLAAVSDLAAEGAAIFSSSCASCHGPDGRGPIGPDLTDAEWRFGGRPCQVLRTIESGSPARGMPAWRPILGEAGARAVAAYVIGTLAAPAPATVE